ncbi:uncharacterized protein UV8b_04852 [Ustilaginoidea virens]|uniref:Integral membrane protein n=2 Tax=Ustilaginoidea virens TaxID=1159556 RepID=A0A8E5MI36_USTVR|nr:uncharacterized protein UV8b_04852 [Ustilaginoidea virens]QUC20611.1 hypothetical protein UV8b_04852 [Ustilaginoidea virens]
MDSFMKAAKSGLAKTVAAGQQQLQQRLAKYGQPGSGSDGSTSNGSEHQRHGQQHHQHQCNQRPLDTDSHSHPNWHQTTSPGVSQHVPYFPPPPSAASPPQQRLHEMHQTPLPQTANQGQHMYQPPPPPPPPPPVRQSCNQSVSSDMHYPQSSQYGHPPLPPRWDNHQQPRLHVEQGGYGTNLSASPVNTYQATAQTLLPASLVPYPTPSQQRQSEVLPRAEDGVYKMSHSTLPANLAQVQPQAYEPASSQEHQSGVTAQTETVSQQHASGVNPLLVNNTINPSENTAREPQQLSQVPPPTAPGAGAPTYVPGLVGSPTPKSPEITRIQPSSTPGTDVPGAVNNDAPQHHPARLGDSSSITQQMGNLDISRQIQEQAADPNQSAHGSFTNAKNQKLPPIVANGPSRDVIRYCPEDRIVDYPLFWYQLPDAPDFLVCTKCHQDFIESTPLAGNFKRILAEPGSRSMCRFWYPRVKNILWKQALRRNSVEELCSFMKRRLQVPDCRGTAAVLGSEGIKWFSPQDQEIPGFVACQACHEDRIMGTSFESRFVPNGDQGAEDQWTCDACLPYMSRALDKLSSRNDWSGFVAGSTRRLQLPTCEGRDSSATEGVWYALRRKLDDFFVCGTCYMDQLELTAFEAEFEAVNQAVYQSLGFDRWMDLLGQKRSCKLTSSGLAMGFALDAGLRDGDFNGFWSAAQMINKLVPCTPNGIVRGRWWTLAGGCANFDICEACYVGIFKTNELDGFLQPRGTCEATLLCNFCPAAPRFLEFFKKLAEALDRSVFSYYTDYVTKFAHVAECPGLDHRENSTWWGYDQVLWCEECQLTFVAETSLGKEQLQYAGASDARAQICQMWSPRMRGMWLDVCRAGEAGPREELDHALVKLKEFGERRLQVYLQTVPRIRFIRKMKEIRMMQAVHQGHLSVMYSGMNSLAAVSGTGDGNWHGNSQLGWYETEHGATGAQMFNNMQAGFADANRTDEWMQIMQLQTMWSEVE